MPPRWRVEGSTHSNFATNQQLPFIISWHVWKTQHSYYVILCFLWTIQSGVFVAQGTVWHSTIEQACLLAYRCRLYKISEAGWALQHLTASAVLFSPCAFLNLISCLDIHQDNQPCVALKTRWPSFLLFSIGSLTCIPCPFTIQNHWLRDPSLDPCCHAFDMMWYDIYLLTAIGLPPGGSSTVHIYTQTIHRMTQNKQYKEWHKTNNT